jgi:endoglucanase
MLILLDMHNYARYHNNLIGTAAVPNAAFGDVWRKLAEHYRNERAVWAYGLMNEPHDTNGLWPAAAQAGVDGVRAADMSHTILVAGDGWSGAWSWLQHNANLAVKDPANNFMYEAHQYFDSNASGTYTQSYDASGAYPMIGVDRAKPFVEWLKARNARGFMGEYGVPDTDPRWLTVMDNFLTYLDQNAVGGTYWAGGPWWGTYPLSVEPRNGQDRPQMSVLQRHLSK